jgi:hypothetical protein
MSFEVEEQSLPGVFIQLTPPSPEDVCARIDDGQGSPYLVRNEVKQFFRVCCRSSNRALLDLLAPTFWSPVNEACPPSSRDEPSCHGASQAGCERKQPN